MHEPLLPDKMWRAGSEFRGQRVADSLPRPEGFSGSTGKRSSSGNEIVIKRRVTQDLDMIKYISGLSVASTTSIYKNRIHSAGGLRGSAGFCGFTRLDPTTTSADPNYPSSAFQS